MMDLFVISPLYEDTFCSFRLLNRLHSALQCEPASQLFRRVSNLVLTISSRYALQDMDKFSLKDSGRGDSEAGDSDCDMGRESPVDRLLLGEGFSDLIHLEMHHRLHPGELMLTTSLSHSLSGYCCFLFFSPHHPHRDLPNWLHSAESHT